MDDFDKLFDITFSGEKGNAGKDGKDGLPIGKAIENDGTFLQSADMKTDGDLIIIKSRKGDKGDKGDSIKGDKGDKGDSIKGEKGDAGTNGINGKDGASAYELWLSSNEGTEEDFLKSLKGKDAQQNQWVGNAYTDLNELENVTITSPANNDVLKYNSTTRKWVNGTGGGGTSTLTNTHIFVGNASNVATDVVLSGDATIANTGALTIANDAVTYAKMQNVTATDKILGRSTAGAGDVEEITCTAAGRALLDDTTASAQRTTLGMEDYYAPHSTGLKTGGVLSIGTGGAGVATSFTIALGVGLFVDNTTIPATLSQVSWTAKTDVAVTNIGTQPLTFVAIDSGGNVIQQATDFTDAQHRQYIVIGAVIHTNLTTVTAVNQLQHLAISPQSQLNDLMQAIAGFNSSGNLFSANGANLNINKSAGVLFKQGSNYATSANSPNSVTTGSLTAASFRYNNQTGAASASVTAIDPDNYDNAGSTTSVPVNKFTVQRIFLFPSNLISIQRGQAVYNSLAEAKAAIQTETFVVSGAISPNGVLRAFLVVKQGATALNSATSAFFLEAPKFGGTAGVGGLSVSTMQNTYDNSSNPEILTDSTRGALSIKRGSAADTDTVLEVLNNAGSTTFSVTGNGVITGVGTSLTGTAANLTSGISNALQSATTTVDVSAATAPSVGQVLTATSSTAATWQAPTSGSNAYNTLTDAATVAVDLSLGNNFFLAIAGNRTLGVPTNVTVGQFGFINVRQDITGARTLAFAWPYIVNNNAAGTTINAGKAFMTKLRYSVNCYATATVTMTIATPCVITWTAHGLITGQQIQMTTTGALPTGVTANTTYYITKIDANTFNISTSMANVGTATFVASSGSQSGTHTAVNMGISLEFITNNTNGQQ